MRACRRPQSERSLTGGPLRKCHTDVMARSLRCRRNQIHLLGTRGYRLLISGSVAGVGQDIKKSAAASCYWIEPHSSIRSRRRTFPLSAAGWLEAWNAFCELDLTGAQRYLESQRIHEVATQRHSNDIEAQAKLRERNILLSLGRLKFVSGFTTSRLESDEEEPTTYTL